MIHAYIRVSDNRQDEKTQRHQIEQYLTDKSITLADVKWHLIHGVSGSKTVAKDRGWSTLLSQLNESDHVIVCDISRIGRRTAHETLNVITDITSKSKCTLHIVRGRLKLIDSNDVAELFIAIGKAYAAADEAQANSDRQKAAVARRRSQKLPVGRQPGTLVTSKLDRYEADIRDMIEAGIPKTAIARKYKVSRGALYNWIERGGNVRRKAKEAESF